MRNQDVHRGPVEARRQRACRASARPAARTARLTSEKSGREDLSSRSRSRVRSDFLGGDPASRSIALHPGSGSETKNWPIENWEKLGEHLFSHRSHGSAWSSGEADEERARLLESAWKGKPVRFAKNLPLPQLAALFENARLHRTRQRNFAHRRRGRRTMHPALRPNRSRNLGAGE